ncbi:MAG: CRISPR-associated helicase Cas3', partial [Candidatus Ratteibacteria bacterium]
MSEIWAKGEKGKGIALSQHTQHILYAFEKIKDKIPDHIQKAIKIAIFYHDFGKVIPAFQIKELGNKNYEPFDVIYEIPHSLFSVFWINEEKIKENLKDENLTKFIISAVAYHHWRESFDDYIATNTEFKEFAKKVLDYWSAKLEENLKNEFQQFKNDSELSQFVESISLNEKKLKEVLNGIPFYQIAIPPYKFEYFPLRESIPSSLEDTKKWILISGFLQRCDHFASFCEEGNENLDLIENPSLSFDEIKKKIKNKLNQQDESKIWQIQKLNDEKRNKNLILIAPTGYGKTEFAFLWSNSGKFIYTLPLRSAVNQIYERAKGIFGDEKVGLLHSDADIYLLEKEKDVGDIARLYDLAKNLSYPAIISTGDQFFPYALRPPGYEKIFALFSYSRLVIDEVQAYDPKACAIIVSFIEWVYRMGGKFLLMSATMPSFVLGRIGERYDLINIYEEEKENFQKIFKHNLKIKVIENENSEISEIINQAKNGKRVLVILNTVKKAQEIYEQLKEKADNSLKDKIFLIHSRFTFEDRRKKEFIICGGRYEIKEEKTIIFGKEIDLGKLPYDDNDLKIERTKDNKLNIEIKFSAQNKVNLCAEEDSENKNLLISGEFKNPKPKDENEGKILVATQVIEASLDIDADI